MMTIITNCSTSLYANEVSVGACLTKYSFSSFLQDKRRFEPNSSRVNAKAIFFCWLNENKTMSQSGGGTGGLISTDMDEHGDMRPDAMKVAAEALSKGGTEQEVSQIVKTHFDSKYGPCWHCIVGTNFRCYCSHMAKTFIFFYVGGRWIYIYICLFLFLTNLYWCLFQI